MLKVSNPVFIWMAKGGWNIGLGYWFSIICSYYYSRCNTYFCYLCESPLSKVNPYGHYSNPQSKCFNQLFEGANQEDFVDHGAADDNGDIRFIANGDDFSSDEEFIVVEDDDGLLRLL